MTIPPVKVVTALALLPILGCDGAEEYPSRPIVLVCPWSMGGGTDRVSRQVAALLEQDLGVAVNVINAIGGEGVTGHSQGAGARPDGHTITMMTVEINMLHWRGKTELSHRDFTPVALLNRDSAAIFVRDDAPWKTLADLADHARRSASRLRASGTAQWGIWHLALSGWLTKTGLTPGHMNWISIAGAAPSLNELAAGGVEVVCCSLPEASAFLDSRRVRCLGVMSERRVAHFPDVPTLREQGVDWMMEGWRGVGLPAGAPGHVTQKLAATLERLAGGEAFLGFMRMAGFNATFEGPAEFERSLQRADRQLGALLTSPAFAEMGKQRFGSMFFPAVLAGALALALVGLLATGAWRPDEPQAPITRSGLARAGEAILVGALFIAAVPVAGYVAAGALLLGALLWRWGTRPWRSALVAALLVPATYQLFKVHLGVLLPQGWLGW